MFDVIVFENKIDPDSKRKRESASMKALAEEDPVIVTLDQAVTGVEYDVILCPASLEKRDDRCDMIEQEKINKVIESSRAVKHTLYEIGTKKIVVSEGQPSYFTDLFLVRDGDSNHLYKISDIDMTRLVDDLSIQGNKETATMRWELPYRSFDDHGLLASLMGCEKSSIVAKDRTMCYSLICVEEVREEWFYPLLEDTIKRIHNDSELIVFQVTQKLLFISDDLQEVTPFKDYHIIHNEKYRGHLNPFNYTAVTKNRVISITSKDPFHQMFGAR